MEPKIRRAHLRSLQVKAFLPGLHRARPSASASLYLSRWLSGHLALTWALGGCTCCVPQVSDTSVSQGHRWWCLPAPSPLPVVARACDRRSHQLVASDCLGWRKEWPRQSLWSFSKNRTSLGDRSPGAYLFHYCPKHPFIKERGTVWITQKQRSIAVIPESKILQRSKSSRTYEMAHRTGN